MKEDQELKYVCKFCNKSFPCGRSLGGHMRSHLINSSFDQTKKKLPSIEASSPIADYGLRENPKKASKFAESSEDTNLVPNQIKVCKECGKSFQSWKALFGHMKCHSEKIISYMNSTVEEDSWNNDANYAIHKQVMDIQSDTETATPNKKKRSSRKIKRYITTTTSSTVTEIEQEQEEVAMSLIILSKDSGNWVGLNLFTDENGSKISKCKDGELVKLKKVKNGKPEQGESSKSNARALRIPRNGYKMDKSEESDDKQKKIKEDKENRFEESQIEVHYKLDKGSYSKKRNFEMNECDISVDSNTKKLRDHDSDSEKKIKFECTTCNKSFYSYQALGGHRASHKRTKGCENITIAIEHTQNQAADNKLTNTKNSSNDSTIDEFGEKVETSSVSKKLKGYECPICFKIFQSGQALGGHKRSHLIAKAKSNNQAVILQKPTPEIRDFLDLNLPAPVEEESSEHVGFQTWWIGSSHKHEQLVGLISN
ncbi:uncharacterized protein LOC107832070 isoform X1 [Nicotiana tabacum]|uniref:Uncharacterized protein LOC107832070 isoform X1 n=1 Tax=Nicotiana tabacum TaxID=4097 RepID=A0A1S4DPL6_TOBAC|nr:PREDICTED: zinc finger protein ZAT9-like isoform X1 [Nicotiana tabacum]